jgi:maleamate amidohydrolase
MTKPAIISPVPALVLIDMQEDVVHGRWWSWWPSIDDVVQNCVELVAACRANEIPVIFTVVEYAPDGSNTPSAIASGDAQPTEYLVQGMPGVELVPEFEPASGELVAVKNLVSAFDAKGVVAVLERLGVDTLIVAGLAVEGGVNATVIDDRADPLDVIVVSDCVAAFSESSFDERVGGTFLARASVVDRHEAIRFATAVK